jgi:hypothetical protein
MNNVARTLCWLALLLLSAHGVSAGRSGCPTKMKDALPFEEKSGYSFAPATISFNGTHTTFSYQLTNNGGTFDLQAVWLQMPNCTADVAESVGAVAGAFTTAGTDVTEGVWYDALAMLSDGTPGWQWSSPPAIGTGSSVTFSFSVLGEPLTLLSNVAVQVGFAESNCIFVDLLEVPSCFAVEVCPVDGSDVFDPATGLVSAFPGPDLPGAGLSGAGAGLGAGLDYLHTCNGSTPTSPGRVTLLDGFPVSEDCYYGPGYAVDNPAGSFEAAYERLTLVNETVVDSVHIRYVLAPNFVDNTFGSNTIGWGTNTHTFKDLVKSDHCEVQLYNGNGDLVYEYHQRRCSCV